MKKLVLIGSFLIAFSGFWMMSCEPSKKGGGPSTTTDSVSTQNNSSTMDSTARPDTSNHKR